MKKSTERLIELGGSPLGSGEPTVAADLLTMVGSLANDLLEFLRRKNGFYAFEAALHVFPAESHGVEIGLNEWNDPRLWIGEYGGMANGYLFFAEDIFGGQFCMKADGIYQYDPETSNAEKVSADLDGWATTILDDYPVLTGYSLAHEWQRANGKIASGTRLVPKVPFVAGGEFSLKNLYPLEAAAAMRLRANIASQIRDLPDGAQIRLKVID